MLIPKYLLSDDIKVWKTKVSFEGSTDKVSSTDHKVRAEIYKEQRYQVSGDMEDCKYVFYADGDVDVKGDYFVEWNGQTRTVIKVDKHKLPNGKVDHTKIYTN